MRIIGKTIKVQANAPHGAKGKIVVKGFVHPHPHDNNKVLIAIGGDHRDRESRREALYNHPIPVPAPIVASCLRRKIPYRYTPR